MIIPFTLPMPPGVNHLFPTVRGRRVKSKAYKDWEREAALALSDAAWKHNPPSMGAEWGLTVTYVMPDRRRRDLDGKLKATIDFLATTIGLEDTNLIAIIAVKEIVKGESYCMGRVQIVLPSAIEQT